MSTTLTGVALAAFAPCGTLRAEPVVEWRQHTTVQFLPDATWRGGPHSRVVMSDTTISWSDRDSTSQIQLLDAGVFAVRSGSGGAQYTSDARTAGLQSDDAQAGSESLMLRHENSVISRDHSTLASVSLQVQGTLHAMSGGLPSKDMPFAFMTEIVFLESANHGACAFDMGGMCPDLLFTAADDLLGERRITVDGVQYVHSPLVLRPGYEARHFSAEECDRVEGWDDRGACVGLVTAENSASELALDFRVATVLGAPAPTALVVLALGLMGATRRRRQSAIRRRS